MRPVLISLVPMFAAAVLVMVGGERMARREVETRTPIDRDRLFDFDEKLRAELERLDILYQNHLTRLAQTLSTPDMSESQAREALANVAGVLRMQTFPRKGAGKRFDRALNPPRLPQVVLSDGERPLDSRLAVFLEKDFAPASLPAAGEWRKTPMPGVLVCLLPTGAGDFATLLIDRGKLNETTCAHLTSWLEMPVTPLREAGERVRIIDPIGQPLLTTGPDHFGPAAAILPIRTSLGNWQIEAWDVVTTRATRDLTVMVVSTGLAVLLAISGILLYHQQRRAMKLAAERVSFVNRVSHELGTPLTNLALNLDLARKERGAIELHPTRGIPAEVLADTITTFRPALERRGIEIETEFDASQPALLDSDALAQITGNLISNVEKYASSGQWIQLAARQDDG
ncbi:MAG: hypothetical protein MUF04_05845, partial [Akkermansiaceae bacterium]|nr:hypothetical protein [Akkermansiaceae bacterium]